jgi:hypothetical protein
MSVHLEFAPGLPGSSTNMSEELQILSGLSIRSAPAVAIALPVYNGADHLEEALSSFKQ